MVGIDGNEDGLKELPESIRYEVGDPTDPAVAKRLVDRIAVDFGPPEVLVTPWVRITSARRWTPRPRTCGS